jgi:leucyl aminopeptidase
MGRATAPIQSRPQEVFLEPAFTNDTETAALLLPVTPGSLEGVLASRPARWRNWTAERGFAAKAGRVLRMPSEDGRTEAVLLGHDPEEPLWMLADAYGRLWPGSYRVDPAGLSAERLFQAAVGWGLAAYRFERYRKSDKAGPRLVWPEGVDPAKVEAIVAAHTLARDLINTAPVDMMPEHLAQAASDMAVEFGAGIRVIDDGQTIAREYPCIHAVGAASAFGPRVLEMTWGAPGTPHVVLAGKGVCFDSGGLNLKQGSHMRLMKKDMGGAAIALGVARLVMALALPIRMTVLIGAVENAVGGRAFRPGDVLTARNGRTIEIDNTDAEGRLVLADLLVRAGQCSPDLLIDFATLTGAARVAVGTEIAAFFTDDEGVAEQLAGPSRHWDDPVWRLPLHKPYRHMLESEVADLVNSAAGGYAGAISAALFLQEFVPEGVPWVHFDVMAWNLRARPGRPKGGEAMGLRAVLGLLEARYTRS